MNCETGLILKFGVTLPLIFFLGDSAVTEGILAGVVLRGVWGGAGDGQDVRASGTNWCSGSRVTPTSP